MKTFFLSLAGLTLVASAGFAQNVTVNPGGATFATLKGAFDAINAGSPAGAIAITVSVSGNTTETATASLNASGVGAASYTSVTVTPIGGARTITGSIAGAIIKLNGADNVTIDGRIAGSGRNLTVSNSSTAANTAAIWLASVAAGNGASNNVIRNLEIAAGATANTTTNVTFGIIMCGTTIGLSINGDDNDNNSFIANRIIRAAYGIVTRGTTTNLNIAPIVTDNIIGPTSFGGDEIGRVGIFMQADTGATVSRNTIQFVGGDVANVTAGADRMGIALGSAAWSTTTSTVLTSNTYTVTKNVIHDIVEERTFSVVGIESATTGGGSATNNLIANNFIYNIRADGTDGDQLCGIGIVGGHTDKVVFNSISITGDMDPGAVEVSNTYGNAIRMTQPSGATHANLTLADNSIYLDAGSGTAAVHFYAITANSAAYSFGTGFENYNNLYINAANTQLRTGGLGTVVAPAETTEFATLANWKLAYTANQDANSIQADPLYLSNTSDLHLGGASPNINTGLTIAGVADDIDAETRPNGANPDIGADEFYGPPGSLQFSSATYSVAEVGLTATITVTRTGGSSGAVSVDYATAANTASGGVSCGGSVDYVNTSGTLSWANNDAAPKTFTVTVCNDGVAEGSETVDLVLSNVVGATAGSPTLAVLTINNSTIFNGSVNVGIGQTYTSLTNPGGLFDAINNGSLTGTTFANITSDLAAETGAVTLNQFIGNFALVIQPSGGALRTVSGSNASALITLSGADKVQFNGVNIGGDVLLIRNTNTTSGSVFLFNNDSSEDAIYSCRIEAGNGSSAILINTGTTTGNDNIAIVGNIISGRSDVAGVPFNAIACVGTSAAISNSILQIDANLIQDFNQAGILIGSGSDNVIINGNDIVSTATRSTTQFGIVFNSVLGGNTVNQNSIHGLRTTVAAGGGNPSTVGILMGDARATTISENKIYDFPAAAGGTGNIVGIEFNGANATAASLNIVNNMISLSTTVATNQTVIGLYDFGFGGNTFTADYNSIYLGGSSSGTNASWAIARGFLAPTTFTARNNVAFNNRTGGGANHFAMGDQSANTGTFVSDYNFFAGTGTTAANFFDYGTSSTGTPVSFATWKTGAPARDANSIANIAASYTISNIFVDAAGGNLHSASNSSPMANAGIPVATSDDFDFDQRSNNRPDIGADEFFSPDLANLTVSVGVLTPAFSPLVASYTDDVSHGTTSITVTPTVLDSNATVTVNGVAVVSGNPSGPIGLGVGANAIDILVIPEFEPAALTEITVNRAALPPVTVMGDSGPGSLREALANALDNDFITFDMPLTAPQAFISVITLTSGELVINKNVTISGPAATQLEVTRNPSAPAFRIFHIVPGKTVTIQGLTINNGLATGGFPASAGGGIYNDNSALTVTACALSGNVSDYGGGIFSDGDSGSASLILRVTTLDGNNAAFFGGGVFSDGEAGGTATLEINNCTFSGNSATGNGGGAIMSSGVGSGSATMTIANSTLANNSSPTGGGIYNLSGVVTIGNTILKKGSAGPNITNSGGSVTSAGYNLSSDAAGGDTLTGPGGLLPATGDQRNTDPMLLPLANYGGLTSTHKPLVNSPAIDQGKRDTIPALTTNFDQRGLGRPVNDTAVTDAGGGDGSDIGAVEIPIGVHPTGAASWKTHPGIGPFPMPLTLSGPVGVECRSGGVNGDFQIKATFASSVSFTGASVSDGAGNVFTSSGSGTNVATVDLTGVTNAQRVTVALFGVNNGTNSGDLGIRMGVLLGDVNGDGFVLSGDYTATRQKSGTAVGATTFQYDVNVDGFILSGDYTTARQKSGTQLP